MKVVCGLGNPGSEYQATRHNVGWWLLDRLQQEWRFENFRRAGNSLAAEGRLGENDVLLLKPLTYMNRSGAALLALRQRLEFDPAQLLVVVDDVALPVGKIRIRAEGSSGGHNGLKSIEAALATQQYARLRIGVGDSAEEDLADWVLSPFESEDEQIIREQMPRLVRTVEAWLNDGVQAANRELNQ